LKVIEACKIKPKQDPEKTKKTNKRREETEHFHNYMVKEGEDPLKVRSITSHVVMVDKNGVTKWYCSFCQLEFKSKTLLYRHSKSVHASKKFRCDICPDSENLRWNEFQWVAQHKFKQHNIVLEGFKVLSCDKCSFKSLFDREIIKHAIDTHPEGGDEAKFCTICNKSLKTVTTLRKHMEVVHMGLMKFECDKCDKKFALRMQLINHEMDVHGPDGPVPKGTKREVCPICGTRLKNHSMLKAHMKLHDLPRVQCTKCDKWLTNKFTLQTHDKATHSRGTKYECPVCPNTVFYRAAVLQDHCMYHHIKIKPFICTTCGGGYWQKIVMGRHIAMAHENWPKDKADKDWKFLLREKPSLFKQIPILPLTKKFLGDSYKGQRIS